MNKNILTNIVSILFIIFGFIIENNTILYIGLFAFSGAVTNSLAIYMLFEKVPFLYGSGVIEDRFEDFKASIKNLLLEQFFTKEKIEKFLGNIDFDNIDFNPAFESLKSVVMDKFGGAIMMFGIDLDSLKEPFLEKMNSLSKKIFENINLNENIEKNIESIIQERLDELTPKMVKEIVEDFIRNHLGWLVVWGGVFGGLIGGITSLIKF